MSFVRSGENEYVNLDHVVRARDHTAEDDLDRFARDRPPGPGQAPAFVPRLTLTLAGGEEVRLEGDDALAAAREIRGRLVKDQRKGKRKFGAS